MPDRPNGEELLKIARHTLLEEILPHAGPAQKYALVMAAAAIAIAQREIVPDPAMIGEEIKLISECYGENPKGEPSLESLGEWEKRLAGDIRNGTFDGERFDFVRDKLRATART